VKQRWGARLLRWGLLFIALGALGSGLRFYDPATRDLPAAFLLLLSTLLFSYCHLVYLSVNRYLRSTAPGHCAGALPQVCPSRADVARDRACLRRAAFYRCGVCCGLWTAGYHLWLRRFWPRPAEGVGLGQMDV
jgi:hypothetical protein